MHLYAIKNTGVICNMTSVSNSFQSSCPIGRVLGKNYLSFLGFTRNYKRTSGIYAPCSFEILSHFAKFSEIFGRKLANLSISYLKIIPKNVFSSSVI